MKPKPPPASAPAWALVSVAQSSRHSQVQAKRAEVRLTQCGLPRAPVRAPPEAPVKSVRIRNDEFRLLIFLTWFLASR